MTPTLRSLATAALALLLAACAGQAPRPAPAALAPPASSAPPVEVAEAYVTVATPEDEIDSVAAWLSPAGDTWVIATAKQSNRLVVYDGDTGATLRTFGGSGEGPGQFHRPNGIAVYADLLFVVERDNQRVQVLHLPDFAPVAMIGKGDLLNPYGLWLHEVAPGELEMLVTDSFMADFRTGLLPPMSELDQRVKRFRVTVDGGRVSGELTGHFGDTGEAGALRMVESLAGDPVNDRLLIAEEDTRVGTTLREYRMDGRYSGRDIPKERFHAQAEGLTLWTCPDGNGYWIAVDQSEDRTVFLVFDRRDLHYRGSFIGGIAALTDGIWLQAAASRRFPDGALYAVHLDRAVAAFDLRAIATALDLPAGCITP
jgi:3-phytase